MRRTVKNKGGRLPKAHFIAHDLCFAVHDILGRFLESGEASGIFSARIEIEDPAEAASFKSAQDIFEWLEATGRLQDRAAILKVAVLPAVLSDLLHCIYETLETSRKGKLNVSYMLIRKPLQESLYLLEAILLDELDFANQLASDPLKLRHKMPGSVDGHRKRIQSVLEKIGLTDQYDAAYIAQLRYAKVEDGFDGVCNRAMHLFTEHQAIRTEVLNVNFIFSGWDEKEIQWNYIYSRLPYLIIYIWHVVEFIGETVCGTHPDYMGDMSRRIAAYVALSEGSVTHMTPELQKFYDWHRAWLQVLFADAGQMVIRKRELERMAVCGCMPGESTESIEARRRNFELHAAAAIELERVEQNSLLRADEPEGN